MRRFLAQLALAFAAMLAAVATLNYCVDPYRIWQPAIGLSAQSVRPRAVQQVALLKARGIERTRSRTVVLGNSRAEIGFDPRSDAWPPALLPVYNAAIPGSTVRASTEYLEGALAAGGVSTVIVGLDFPDFLTEPDATSADGDPDRAPRAFQHGWRRAYADLQIVLSLDTLFDAIVTLASRDDPDSADITADGFNPLRQYNLYARQEGYGAIFLQRDSENARTYARLPRSIFTAEGTSDAWRELDRFLEVAKRHRIDVKFVIYPYHAHILEMFREAGLEPAFEAWKEELVRVIEPGDPADARTCTLWDFSGYNRYAREPVPRVGDKDAAVHWYWESGHFKHELGDLMLARMFGSGDASFGTCLTATNVADNIRRMRGGHEEYVRDDADDSATMADLVRARTHNDDALTPALSRTPERVPERREGG
ncbi:MAG: hypothetical protein ACRD4E_14360 [Bryobacteraceae bacterium]